MFMLEDREYYEARGISPYNTYFSNKKFYLDKLDVVVSDEDIKSYIGNSGFKDPIATFYNRDSTTFDKAEDTLTMSAYVNSIHEQDLTVAPSLTCYRKDIPSLDADWTVENVVLRSKYKSEAKVYEMKKDFVNYGIYSAMEKTKKMKNNALSGLYSVEALPIHTHSAHYSLTSTTRMTSGIGNVLTERMVAGNRFYRVKDDVIDEMITYIRNSSLDVMREAVDTYSLTIPTLDDIMTMVRESSKWYWIDEEYMSIVEEFVNTLTDIEKVCILYAHDLYHLFKLNKDFMTNLFDELSMKVPYTTNDMSIMSKGDYDIKNTVHMVYFDELKGTEVDYDAMKDSHIGKSLASKYRHIAWIIEEKQLFIDAFFRKVHCVPINVQFVKEMVRKVIVLSDTDSTCGGLFDLVKKSPDERFDIKKDHVRRMAGAVLFLSGTMNHTLHIYAANINAKVSNYGRLQMKAEYIWSLFLPALVSKHYLTSELIKEMYVLEESNTTTSGASYVASSSPPKYRQKLDEFREYIKTPLENGQLLNAEDVILKVIEIEDQIFEDMKNNIVSLLRTDKVKNESAYKQGWEHSNFFNHVFYIRVLESKYGSAPKPPYRVVKLPITTSSKTKMTAFLDELDNKEMAESIRDILKKAGKKDGLSTLKLPISIFMTKEIPEEFIPILNKRKVVNDIMKPIYMILNSIGIFTYDDSFLQENHSF